jgi:hypothetical protein
MIIIIITIQTSYLPVSVIKVTISYTCMKYLSAFRREMLVKAPGKRMCSVPLNFRGSSNFNVVLMSLFTLISRLFITLRKFFRCCLTSLPTVAANSWAANSTVKKEFQHYSLLMPASLELFLKDEHLTAGTAVGMSPFS